ncbi:MAG: transporter substrate-binding domain-containing protein [Deltaproteobacteria bacterium]|nr:transporter substrate-binding domain-containing protein [Deltaproteobacteria bacterium]
MGISTYSPPVFFNDDKDFTIYGISVDIAKIIADNMGVTLQFHTIDDLGYAEALEKDVVDFIICIRDDLERLEAINLIETDLRFNRHFFVNTECDTFTSLKDLPGHTVIVAGGKFISRLLSSRSDISFVDPDTMEEGYALLDSGKVQVLISHSNLMDLAGIKKLGFHNIKEVGIAVKTAPLVMASDKKNEELNASLQKAYEKAITSAEYDQILNLLINKDTQYINADKRNIMVFITSSLKYIKIITGIVIIAFGGIIFWNNLLKRKVNEIKKDLYQSEQRYKDLIESSPDMIFLVFPDGRIRSSNKMALNSFGYNENEIKLLKLHDLVLSEEVDSITFFLDQLYKDNYAKGEFTLLSKRGTGIRVEMVANVVKWGSNGETLACTFSRDLTERIRLEEKLIDSDRLAVMGRMAAGIAHEINNPLGIILTNAGELVNHQHSVEDIDESLKSIERNAVRAAKTIEDLLSYTRPSPMKKEFIDLIPLIDESLFFLKHRLEEKNIKIENQYSNSPITLWGDEKMIQQLLINIMLNAIQALKNDGKITIKAEFADGFGDNVILLEIRDNGVGIHNDDIQKIFDPFYTSRKEGGFGLGLYISKVIVDKHNGNIFIKSDLFKGTVVTVLLPCGVEKTSAAA